MLLPAKLVLGLQPLYVRLKVDVHNTSHLECRYIQDIFIKSKTTTYYLTCYLWSGTDQ